MNRIAVYEPSIASLTDAFPGLLQSLFGPVTVARDALEVRIDVSENETGYTVLAEMPGVNKDDIQVQIDGNKVRIAAEVKRVDEPKAAAADQADAKTEASAQVAVRRLRSERYYGAVARSFALASELDEAASSAKYENGVLTLVLPKKAAVAAKRLTVH
jgi:HSP20 family protein